MTMITAPPQTYTPTLDGLLAELAALTDQLVSTVRRDAANDHAPRLPVAGHILGATSRLTAAAVEVVASVTHRGVIADVLAHAGVPDIARDMDRRGIEPALLCARCRAAVLKSF